MADNVVYLEAQGQIRTDFEAALTQMASQLDKDVKGVAPLVSRELMASLQRVASLMQSKHGNPYSSGLKGDDVLHSRSGAGLKSLLASVKVTGATFESIEGTIGTGDLGIHETGGTITAGGGWLTVPLPAALDSRGMPIKLSARDWPNTFCQKSRKGNLIIFQRNGRELLPLYVLKKSITLKPRLGLENALDNELPFFLERVLDRFVEELDL